MKIVIAGGSMAGLACAHALLNTSNPDLKNELQIVVLEKARTLTSSGAGIGLEQPVRKILDDWNLKPSIDSICSCLYREEHRISDVKKETYKVLAFNDKCVEKGTHWSDLHKLLYGNLPDKSIVKWGHELVSFCNKDDGSGVSVQVRGVSTQVEFGIDCDILIGADGVRSTICSLLFPDAQRNYVGHCAWRGVYEYGDKSDEIIGPLRSLYPGLGRSAYFEMARDSHLIFFEMEGKRINWLWYRNQPDPQAKGTSTVKLDEQQMEKMHKDARETWLPQLSALVNATPAPFVNALYDRDPLQHMMVGRVVLVGDAAHPTSPHCAKGTNMAIQDAATLAKFLSKWAWGAKIDKALAEYEELRLPATSRDVLRSRFMGHLRQGRVASAPDWWQATEDQCKVLLQTNASLKDVSDIKNALINEKMKPFASGQTSNKRERS